MRPAEKKPRRSRHSTRMSRERASEDAVGERKRATRVLLVDESDVTLLGIYTLAFHLRLNIVGHVRKVRTVPEKAKTLKPDLIFLGPYVDPQEAAAVASEVYRRMPDMKFIFATSGLQAVSGVPRSAYEILEVRTVANDFMAALNRLFPEGHKEEPEIRSRRRRESTLTDREREGLKLLSTGRSAKQIAFLLGISRRTVEFHKYSLMDKTGIRSVAELAVFAVSSGFADPIRFDAIFETR